MQHWIDEAIVLGLRPHGETSAVVSLMTQFHGRHAGLVRGSTSVRTRGLYELGNRVAARWQARLPEHLGNLACELVTAHAARLLDRPARLAMLSAAASLVDAALPEREPHGDIFQSLSGLIDALEREETDSAAAVRYVRWEIALLADLGFGLDLTSCAATGAREDLAFVSPRTGRAVSAVAGAPWRTRLFELPRFLLDPASPTDGAAISAGLRLTGHFLRGHVLHERALPGARARLGAQLAARLKPTGAAAAGSKP